MIVRNLVIGMLFVTVIAPILLYTDRFASFKASSSGNQFLEDVTGFVSTLSLQQVFSFFISLISFVWLFRLVRLSLLIQGILMFFPRSPQSSNNPLGLHIQINNSTTTSSNIQIKDPREHKYVRVLPANRRSRSSSRG